MIVFRPYKYLWSERSNYGVKPEKSNTFNAKLFFSQSESSYIIIQVLKRPGRIIYL